MIEFSDIFTAPYLYAAAFAELREWGAAIGCAGGLFGNKPITYLKSPRMNKFMHNCRFILPAQTGVRKKFVIQL